MSHLLLVDPIDQSVINTALESSVFSQTVRGGTLAGHQALFIEQTGRYNNGNTNGRNYIIRLKYGGRILHTMTSPSPTASTSYHAAVQRYLVQAVATNQLRTVCLGGFGGPASDAGSFAVATTPGVFGTNRVINADDLLPNFDTSIDQQLEITAQLSVAAATHEFVSMGVWVVLIGDGSKASVRPVYAWPVSVPSTHFLPTG